MKKMLLGAAGLFLAVAGPALAADLSPKSDYVAPPISVQADDWGGFFAGVHGGYGWANRTGCWYAPTTTPISSCSGAPSFYTFDYSQAGWLAGAQGGFNWKPSQHFLLGVQIDGSLADIAGTLSSSSPSGGGVAKWTSLATATAKAGVTQGKWLAYVEGGYAIAGMNFDGNLGCDFSMTHSGPVAGAGVAVKVSKKVSVDLKYDHVWLGGQNVGCLSFGSLPTQVRTTASMDIVKLALNYNFGN